jgi:hypothetical protein
MFGKQLYMEQFACLGFDEKQCVCVCVCACLCNNISLKS